MIDSRPPQPPADQISLFPPIPDLKISKNIKRFLVKKTGYKEDVENMSYSVSLFFTVGTTKSEEDLMFLQQEAEEYGDILIKK